MNRIARIALAVTLALYSWPAFAAHGDCYHACDQICWDRIELYEGQIDACANGAPETGPRGGACTYSSGPTRNQVRTSFNCDGVLGCAVTGKLNCGAAYNQHPQVPNIPFGQTGGTNCPMKNGQMPAVVVHSDNFACQYPDGTFIGGECDGAGTGVDVVYGTNMTGSGAWAEANAILQ